MSNSGNNINLDGFLDIATTEDSPQDPSLSGDSTIPKNPKRKKIMNVHRGINHSPNNQICIYCMQRRNFSILNYNDIMTDSQRYRSYTFLFQFLQRHHHSNICRSQNNLLIKQRNKKNTLFHRTPYFTKFPHYTHQMSLLLSHQPLFT